MYYRRRAQDEPFLYRRLQDLTLLVVEWEEKLREVQEAREWLIRAIEEDELAQEYLDKARA